MTRHLHLARWVGSACCLLLVWSAGVRAEPAQAESEASQSGASQSSVPTSTRPGSSLQGRIVLGSILRAWENIVEPASDTGPRTFVAQFKVSRADGLPKAAAGATGEIAFQAPDHLRLSPAIFCDGSNSVFSIRLASAIRVRLTGSVKGARTVASRFAGSARKGAMPFWPRTAKCLPGSSIHSSLPSRPMEYSLPSTTADRRR